MQVPPTSLPDRSSRRIAPRAILAGLVVALFVLVATGRALAVLYTDKLWFSDLGFGDVFGTLIWARIAPALIFGTVMFIVVLVNLIIADRLAPQYRAVGAEDELIERYSGYVSPYMGRIRCAVAFVLGVFVAIGASGQWREWILYRNRVTWGVKDPQFKRDVGFYVFELPFLKFIAQWVFVVLFVGFIVTALFHYLNGGIRFQSGFQRVTPQVKAHLSVILALMAFTKTAQYWLGRYDLVFSQRGRVDGALYTDIHAQLPALEFLALIGIVGGVLFVINIWRRGWTLPIIAVGLWAFISIVVGTAYPAWMQRFQVVPSEASKEAPYISRNIEATRLAFGLNNVEIRAYDDSGKLDSNVIAKARTAETLANVRLWDAPPLRAAVQSTQGVKGYYRFSEPAPDRYRLGSEDAELVMLAARGLDVAGIPSRSWTNKHLAYTHGQGAVVVDGNSTAASGQNPQFLIEGIPQTGSTDLKISQPDIYFSPGLNEFVIAGSKEGEIELDAAGNEIRDSYKGSSGITMSSFLRKAAFAARFGDVNVLLSGRVSPESRMLFARDVRDRITKLAPFLTTDSKAYPVILPDGSLEWVVDAYTTTDAFPYAQELRPGDVPGAKLASNINYARNSVKATVNAYDGTVRLYVIDESDPLIRSYRKAFPDLFTAASEMPDGLAAHLRYPTDLFKAQTRMLEQYHLTPKQAGTFYSGTEAWRLAPEVDEPKADNATTGSTSPSTVAPKGSDGGRSDQNLSDAKRVEPQYLMLELPDEVGQQFVMTTSFVPASADEQTTNRMSAFIAVRNDGFGQGRDFAKITVYTLGSNAEPNSEVFAANQIQKDNDISQKLSLLNQRGSKIESGALQLLPVGNSILYAQPFFISSEDKSSFPGFSFIALSYKSKAVFGNTVDEALRKLFPGGSEPQRPNEPNEPDPDRTLEQKISAAQRAFDAWQKAVAAGDFEESGKQLEKLRAALDALPSGTVAPDASPTNGEGETSTTSTTGAPPASGTTASTSGA